MPTHYKLGDFLSDVNFKKENIVRQDLQAEKEYNAFIVNMMLSHHADCILIVDELNTRHSMSKRMQYDFLIQLVRKGKRFARNGKAPKNDDINTIMDFYQYSEVKALEALSVMSESHVKNIKNKLKKGGRV